MKKILFIIPYVPYPLDSGGNQAFFNMVDHVRHVMDVSLLLYPKHAADVANLKQLQALWPDVHFHIYEPQPLDKSQVRHPLYYKWLGKAKASVTRKMRRQLVNRDPEAQTDQARLHSTLYLSMNADLQEEYCMYVSRVAASGFDIIQVEFYELISLGYWLPKDVATVFVHHEIRYVRNEREITLFRHCTERDRIICRQAKGFELGALNAYRYVIALTEVDRAILASFLRREDNLFVSPAVVRVDEQANLSPRPTQRRLTFVGSEYHYPNLDGVEWFCREVAPRLRARGFAFSFQLVGTWKSEQVKGLQQQCPEMELTGYIDDLHAFLNGSIMLVPIRIGSGMRMKILDAIASKAPFVTTAKGVEGIDLHPGEDFLLADTADDFADAIVRLAADADLQVRLATQAAEHLHTLYDHRQMLQRRIDIYDTITQGKT